MFQRGRAGGVAAAMFGRPSRVEVKSFDVTVTPPAATLTVAANAAGGEPGAAFVGITELNCVRQGAAFYNRIGAKITVRSIQVTLSTIQVVLATYPTVRVLLVYDRQTNGVFPAIADVLSVNDTGVPAAGPGLETGLNIANKSRFQIIRDQYFDMDDAQSHNHTIKMFARGAWDVEFKSNNGNIGDISTGAIYLIVFNDAAANSTMDGCSTRIRYFD